LCKAFVDFLHRFGDERLCCDWVEGRGMGAVSDRFVEEVKVPVISGFGGAAFVGKIEQHWGSGMGQGRAGGGHQAADGAEALALGFG
jgi:hypothetical protein